MSEGPTKRRFGLSDLFIVTALVAGWLVCTLDASNFFLRGHSFLLRMFALGALMLLPFVWIVALNYGRLSSRFWLWFVLLGIWIAGFTVVLHFSRWRWP